MKAVIEMRGIKREYRMESKKGPQSKEEAELVPPEFTPPEIAPNGSY